MNYRQVKFIRFISPTTCYSGLRRLSEDKGTGTIATETDLIHYTSSTLELYGNSLPKPSSDEIACAGHDSLDRQQLFVMIEEMQNNEGEMEDQITVANTNNASSDIAWNSTSSRRASVSSEMSVVTDTASIATGGMSTSNGPTTTTTTTVPEAQEGPLYKSHLVWRDEGAVSTRSFPCRLLTPTLSRITTNTTNNTGSDGYLVWTGSADDAELRCFVLQNGEIETVALDDFEVFNSPIMTIESSSAKDDGIQTLGVGCQDGTVRLLTFSNRVAEDDEGGMVVVFENLLSHTVIVDGPILSLDLADHADRILVGSMCGYACQLLRRQNANNDESEWSEPTMVVQDFLWDARYEADDPVLAVCYRNDRVILGTCSGLLQVYVQMKDASFAVEWSCPLPYPIHTITHVGDTIVVTTKQSLHVFEAKSIYDADRAKERLEKILRDSDLH